MPSVAQHARALRQGLLTGADAYRERIVLEASEPGFEDAWSRAQAIDGYTTRPELSLLYHAALVTPGPGVIVEIGSYLGRSTVVLASAVATSGRGRVVAVDPHTRALGIAELPEHDTRLEFLANLERAGVADHVELKHAYSVDAAAAWDGEPIRLHFVDGWHSRDAVVEDVSHWAPYLTPDAVVVFDDYMASDGVRRGVQDLHEAGTLRRDGAIVGKMAAFGPPALLARLPIPPGGRLLGRVAGRFSEGPRERAIRLGAR
ncbi:MAG TPA: class I SAM-dependent methyltransferase [Solirubrobacter sp.]|nr:class I SAM-dependent methyltransferase [Solirubrobacter sp.]